MEQCATEQRRQKSERQGKVGKKFQWGKTESEGADGAEDDPSIKHFFI